LPTPIPPTVAVTIAAINKVNFLASIGLSLLFNFE
jgi:hypothetical protein